MVREARLKGMIKMEPGGKVQIQGLKNQEDLNGMVGTLLEFDAAKMRWGVELAGGRRVSLKMGNLLPQGTDILPAAAGTAETGPRPAAETSLLDSTTLADTAGPCSDCMSVEATTVAEHAGSESIGRDANVNMPDSGQCDSQDTGTEGQAEGPPAMSEEDWPVLPRTEEQQAQARVGRWFDNESAAEHFAEQLRENEPTLQSLCLVPPKRFNEDDAKDISEALHSNVHCLELLASGHCLSEVSCNMLAEMLQKNKTLQMLSVGDSSLGDLACTIFDGLASNMALTSLDLEHKGLTKKAGLQLASALQVRQGKQAAAMRTLRLSRNPELREALSEIVKAEAPEELYLCECALQPSHAQLLGGWVRLGIKELDLRGNSGFGAEGLEQLLASVAIKGGPAATLKKLRLDGCAVGDDGLEAIAEACKLGLELEELFLEQCEITATGCEVLSQALRRGHRLRHLSVRANVIGDEGCEMLGDCSDRLDLSATSLSGSVLPSLSGQHLVSLELFSNPTLGPSVQTWSADLRCCDWQMLEYLDLSGCSLGNDGFSCLCNMLLREPKLMPKLTCLCLGGNNVEHCDQNDALAESLTEGRNGSLRVIWKDG
mmetsp:Transcript_19112/g.42828  ORF Transcript_19112/g.42828 Transcript_19112/m.42828 type:complete len:601 (+) Transcript_19112:75-1877(+)